MTGELIVVTTLVAAAVVYLVRNLFLRKKGACDRCAVRQAAEEKQRTSGRASSSSGATH